jgi:hypothetical protein
MSPRRLPERPPRPDPQTARRGITPVDVDRAADALLRAGERPTIEKVRQTIGRGSPNTINPLLDQWWRRLAGRLDAGPAALHRLPEPVAHAAEGLWLQALEEARRRAQLERRSARAAFERDRQDLLVQSHILSLRESELKSRIEQAESRGRALELELAALTTLLRKEQASRLAAERRTGDAETRLAQPGIRRRRAAPARATRRPTTSEKSRKRLTKPARGTATVKRRVSAKRPHRR